MKGGMGGLMKQMQQMQANMEKAQEEAAQLEVEGESGGGMVKIIMNGKHEVRRVTIDDTLMGDEDDKEMLEDLLAAAVNDAVRRADEATQEKLAGVTQGMGIPPGFKMPF